MRTTCAVIRPFTLDSSSQFRAEPPPDLNSAQWVEDYQEVQLFGSIVSAERTPAQTEIGRFYGEQPTIQYGRIFRNFAAERGLAQRTVRVSSRSCTSRRLMPALRVLIPNIITPS